jgi:hypothetical protein
MLEDITNLESSIASELPSIDANAPVQEAANIVEEAAVDSEPPKLNEKERFLEKLSNITNDIEVNEEIINNTGQFQISADMPFSAKQMNLDKYLSYGSEIYGQYGFNPLLDSVKQEDGTYKSGMDDLYDQNTTAGDDFYRAAQGMLELGIIGFQDTFALGAFHDDQNYVDFEEVMSTYSSSKGGSTGFWSNTMLSSGYTMGIIGGIFAEELAITALTGGIGLIGAGVVGGTRTLKGLQRLNKRKHLKAVKELGEVAKARTWLGRRGQAVGKGFGKFGKAINPIGETMDFVKNIDRLKDFNGLKVTALGAGSVVRDMRKIYMAHSESQLEADMAETDFYKKNIGDFYLDYDNLDKNGNPTRKNVGQLASDPWMQKLNSEASRVHNNVYAGNFGLIYLTNAITFDNMFKNMKGIGAGRMFGHSTNNTFKATRNAATKKVTISPLKSSPGTYLRGKVSGWTALGTVKSGVNKVLSGSMEGVQELGQDILSESFKNYHSRNVQGTQAKGGLMHYLKNDLVSAIKKQNSHQGLETFASGLFMGVFASPVGFATGQINTFVNGGGYISAAGTYQKMTNKEQYKKSQEKEMASLEKQAVFLTEFFNDNKNFLESWSKPLAKQAELQEEMLTAAHDGNKKDFKDAQNTSFTAGVKKLLDAGLEGEFIEHLNYMGTELNALELNELFARTDITADNISRYQKKLLDNAKLLTTLKAKYKDIQQNIVNPISKSELDPKADNYIEKYIEYAAFEALKEELLFSSSKIVDRAERLTEIKKIISDQNPLVSEFTVESLVDVESLDTTIEMLKSEVEANVGMNLTGSTAVSAKISERRLKALENYKLVLKDTGQILNQADSSETEAEIYDGLFDVYQEVVAAFGKQRLTNQAAQKEVDSKAFDLIFDYIVLETQEGKYTQYAETLMTAAGSGEFVDSHKLMLGRLEENKKEHIKNALVEFSKKIASDKMLKDLYDAGVFFDLQYLDDLITNRVMPGEIVSLKNNEAANAEQVRLATKIINNYVKDLTGKTVIESGLKGKQGRKLKQDKRTVAGILKAYNITIDKNISLSSKEGLKLIDRLLATDNQYLTVLDREVLMKVIEQKVTIRFVEDQTLPIEINEQGIINIDVRFAGEDYTNSAFSIENLITTALTQSQILNDLVENDDLWLEARDAMRQAKVEYSKRYPDQDVEKMPVFTSVDVFLSEALNDTGFQYFLSTIEDKVQPTKKSLWSTIKSGSEEIIKEKFEGKLVNRVINIAAKAVDEKIVDNISEINRKVRTDEATEALDKKEQELKVMGAELGAKWNVNVKVLRDQQEAQEYLDKIKDPFFSKEDGLPNGFYDEKTNTAYIIAEGVKENTPYHEIFLHPFLVNAEKKNPELYKALVAEAKADQSVVDYVEKNYGAEESIGSRQFEHELVGRVYELALANEISEKEQPGLFKRIYEFMKLLLNETGKFLKILPKDISKFKANNTTIKDLAKYSTVGNGIDLGAIIEGTEEVKPKKEKIKVTKTRTKETQENTGGNTVVVKEARDQPTLMEEFINDDIQLENAESVNAATDEIVALGKQLDELDVLADETNWKFGDLRIEVDGRLIIDVIANGKRFLMYKSTGTGTTADTAGEWTPLLYFGTQLKKDGSGRKEWFVKSIFEGQDPKKNKYGIKTFIGLDSLLKAQEAELFSGSENIVTRTETEEVEVEEELITQEVEAEEDTLESNQNKIDQLEAQIKIAKVNLKEGKGTFIEKRRLSSKILVLEIEANELYLNRKTLIKQKENESAPVLEKDSEYIPVYDQNKNEIISADMPFTKIPKVLQNILAELYGKKITLLNQGDIDAIALEMETNPAYIKAVHDYSTDRLEKQNNSLVEINQEKVDRAKAKRQGDIKLEKTNKKRSKGKLTLEEKIKQLPGAELLTDKEIIKFANEIRNQEGVFAFSFLNIRNIITGRLRIEREAIEAIKEEERLKKEKIIADNVNRLGSSGKYELKIVNMKDKIINIPAGMREFMLKYHPEIFLLDQNKFNEEVRDIMKGYRFITKPNQLSNLLPTSLKSGTKEKIREKAQQLIAKLEKNKQLYPSVVIKLNRLLNESGIAYTLKKLSSKQLVNSTSLYELRATPDKKFGADVTMPFKDSGRRIIKATDFDNVALTMRTKAAMAMAYLLLFDSNKLKKLPPTYWKTDLDRERYAAWISNDATKQIDIASSAQLGEQIELALYEFGAANSVNMAREQLDPGSDVPGLSIAEELMADTFTPNDLANLVADMIENDIGAYELDLKNQIFSTMTEEEGALMEYVTWSTTVEGKKIIEAELLSKEQDYLFYEEMFLKELIEKEERWELAGAELFEFDEALAEQLNSTNLLSDKINILKDLLRGQEQGNLNFFNNTLDYIQSDPLYASAKQVAEITNIMSDTFDSGLMNGKVVSMGNKAYLINSYNAENMQVSLTELTALEDSQSLMPLDFFLSEVIQELIPGTMFNGMLIDTVANATEIKYIKDAYADILNNFTSYNKEAESLSDEQLLEELTIELTKCK